MATHAPSATIQLQKAPMEPYGPPPMSLNVGSIGATVWPEVTHQAAPRHTSSPPSVTMNAGTPSQAMTKPCSPPISAPMPTPTPSAASHIHSLSAPMYRARYCVCATPMHIAAKPRMEPTDRSMFRVTMTSTMPVDMIATDEVCTDRFHRFRGDMKRPPDRRSKAIQISSSAPIMPSMRVSISVARKKRARAPSSLARAPALPVPSTGPAEVSLVIPAFAPAPGGATPAGSAVGFTAMR